MYCPNCGYIYAKGAKFCRVCGTKIESGESNVSVKKTINETRENDKLNTYGMQYKQGDESAFQKIYESTEGWVRSFVYNRVSRSEVEDCMQQIYLKLFQGIQLFDETKGTFRGWFNTLVNNETISYMRKHMKPEMMQAMPLYNEDDETIELPASGLLPEEVMEQQDMARIMDDILSEISEEQRQCIMLKYREGLKNREIADILGISEGTVKSRISYGLRKVEGKVVALERQGTKLYSMAPVTFFLWLLMYYDSSVATITGNLWNSLAGMTGMSTVTGGAAPLAGGVTGGTANLNGGMVNGGATNLNGGMVNGGAANLNGGMVNGGVANLNDGMVNGGVIGGTVAASAGKAVAGGVVRGIITKIAIGIATVAVIAGGVTAVASWQKNKNNNNPDTVIEATTGESDVNQTGEVSDNGETNSQKEVEEETVTEEVADEETAMYQAYYDKIMEYQGKYKTVVISYTVDGLAYAKLDDFNGDGKDELLLCYSDDDTPYSGITENYKMEIWKYTENHIELDFDNELQLESSVSLGIGDNGYVFAFPQGTETDNQGTDIYEYRDGIMTYIERSSENYFNSSTLIFDPLIVDYQLVLQNEDNGLLFLKELNETIKKLQDILNIESEENWKELYKEILEDTINTSVYKSGWEQSFNATEYKLMDIDNNKIPEMLIIDSDSEYVIFIQYNSCNSITIKLFKYLDFDKSGYDKNSEVIYLEGSPSIQGYRDIYMYQIRDNVLQLVMVTPDSDMFYWAGKDWFYDLSESEKYIKEYYNPDEAISFNDVNTYNLDDIKTIIENWETQKAEVLSASGSDKNN